MEIRWKSSVSATCLHAAWLHHASVAATDPHLAVALDDSAAALAREIASAGWPVRPLLTQFVALASEHDNNRQLVERALVKLHLPSSETAVVRIAGAIADLEAAVLRSAPALADELPMRTRPLREQWEARGPGMLRAAARFTDEAILPDAAEIVLVAPYAGGHGLAHPAFNRVTLEAMLVNPLPAIPESVRLAWLIAQLNGDLPRFADALPAGRASAVKAAATIPAVLAAAEAVELARCDEATLALAIDAWRLADLGAAPDPKTLWQWWSAWTEHPDQWPVALAALDQMLA
jgi:hypothetical protein